MEKSTVAMLIEVPMVAIKVMVVLVIIVVAWLGWAIAGWLAWHYTGRLDYAVLGGMLGIISMPLSTMLDAIP